MTMNRILRAAAMLVVALLVSTGLALSKSGPHDWGTLSNDWNTEAFGWPVKVWSRTVHSYAQQGSQQWVEQDRLYSIHWGRALGLYLGTVVIVAGTAVCLQKLKPE